MDDEQKKASMKDLYDKLWQARDFEISHQWQRSVFLATFIVLLFTIYFTFLGTLVEYGKNDSDVYVASANGSMALFDEVAHDSDNVAVYVEKNSDNGNANCCLYVIVLDALSILGFSFSVLWICMARGSKYMYERIESGISQTYGRGFFDETVQIELKKEFIDNLWTAGRAGRVPRHSALPLSEYNHRILGFEGSPFSSSRINICIGYLFAVVWTVAVMGNPQLVRSIIECSKMPWWLCFPYCHIEAIVVLIISAYAISYHVLSAGYQNFWAYLCITIRNTFLSRFSMNPDFVQLNWVYWFLREGQTSSAFIWQNVQNEVRRYSDVCDNPLERHILARLNFSPLSNGKHTRTGMQKTVRYILSNENLKSLFEYALMRRNGFNQQFQGTWHAADNATRQVIIDAQMVRFQNIYILAPNASSLIQGIDLSIPGDRVTSPTRLYADTDWRRIRSGNGFGLNRDETQYHIVQKHPGRGTLYIELELVGPDFNQLRSLGQQSNHMIVTFAFLNDEGEQRQSTTLYLTRL